MVKTDEIRSRVNKAISLVDDALAENVDFRRNLLDSDLQRRLDNIFDSAAAGPGFPPDNTYYPNSIRKKLEVCDCNLIAARNQYGEEMLVPECKIGYGNGPYYRDSLGFVCYAYDTNTKNADSFPDLYEHKGRVDIFDPAIGTCISVPVGSQLR